MRKKKRKMENDSIAPWAERWIKKRRGQAVLARCREVITDSRIRREKERLGE